MEKKIQELQDRIEDMEKKILDIQELILKQTDINISVAKLLKEYL